MTQITPKPNMAAMPKQSKSVGRILIDWAAVITLVLSVLNSGAIPFLGDEDVVEVTCNVSKNGIEPVRQTDIPAMCELYIRLIKHYERLSAEAVREKSEDLAIEALMLHPLVNSYSLAKKLIADYNEAYGMKILGE